MAAKARAVRLYETSTMEQLTIQRKAVEDEPTNRSTPGDFYLYTPKARKLLDDINRAITWHLEDRRIARGETINHAGYSGAKQKHR